MKSLKVVGLALVSALAVLVLAPGDSHAKKSNTEIRLCKNIQYALCAASTCKETGKTIAVNTPEGGTRNFPEAACTCPVLPSGDTGAFANLNGGNMQGSCDAPEGGVWSLYQNISNFPQKHFGWNYHDAPLNETCTADLHLGARFVNCWSFACNDLRTVTSEDGTQVTLATCYCPIGEDVFSALPTKPKTGFTTKAGGALETEAQQRSFCRKLPVGGF